MAAVGRRTADMKNRLCRLFDRQGLMRMATANRRAGGARRAFLKGETYDVNGYPFAMMVRRSSKSVSFSTSPIQYNL